MALAAGQRPHFLHQPHRRPRPVDRQAHGAGLEPIGGFEREHQAEVGSGDPGAGMRRRLTEIRVAQVGAGLHHREGMWGQATGRGRITAPDAVGAGREGAK